ncbi:carboxyl-terminal-processing peptidase 2 [Quercus suber]|uniref:Carboxyl-terminal-processing peptidase 2 n=1 Tax=Quercus suber TaxID=58331 RepID=A0AAW0KHL4_QUESU
MLPGFSTSKPQKPIKKSNPKQIKPKFRVAFSSTDPIRFFRVAFSSFAGLRLGSSFARRRWGSSGFGQNRRLGSSFARRRWGSSGFGQNRRLGSSFACRCWGSSGFGQNRRLGLSFARRGWGSSGGPEGSSVELTIRSGPEIKHVALMREKVSLNPVKSRLCQVPGSGRDSRRVGYIKLTSFNQNASGAVKEAIDTLRSNSVNAFVLDLRDNSGGLFPEGIEIAKIW